MGMSEPAPPSTCPSPLPPPEQEVAILQNDTGGIEHARSQHDTIINLGMSDLAARTWETEQKCLRGHEQNVYGVRKT